VRVYAKHYVRQRQNNLTTFFNFNEREIIRLIVYRKDEKIGVKPKGLETWCIENKMDLNATKCKVISFGRSRTKILYSYQINGTLLERVSFIRDLG
jgi:hypothetical protein